MKLNPIPFLVVAIWCVVWQVLYLDDVRSTIFHVGAGICLAATFTIHCANKR